MWHEVLRNLNLIPHDFLLLVRRLLAATVATYLDFLRQHWETPKSVSLSE
jgi:hypothetical protein